MLTVSAKHNAIATIRVKKGLSMRKLARVAGINFKTVFDVEKGAVSPTPSTTKKICDALGVTFDEIFTLKDGE